MARRQLFTIIFLLLFLVLLWHREVKLKGKPEQCRAKAQEETLTSICLVKTVLAEIS
ncbi:MAG: hypothetical protein JSR31_15570 [Nitrospira sp.]|nr:hypothetical protein [Nitrospira sp.]